MILDSGNRTEFASGAVRDVQEGKGDMTLVPLEVVNKLLDYDPIIMTIRNFQQSHHTPELYATLKFFAAKCYDSNIASMILEVSKHFEEGAKKYERDNWKKGIPVERYIDSALRHYMKYLRGDKDEPHDRAFVWNLMCCIWEVDHHKPEGAVVLEDEDKTDDRSCLSCKYNDDPKVFDPHCDDCRYYSNWDPIG